HVDDCGLTYLHVFPFSARPGVPAARMPQVPGDVGRERARQLRERGAERLAAYLAGEVGRHRQVLVEADGIGRTEHFAPTLIPGGRAGEIVPARIAGHGGGRLIAEAVLAEAA